MLDIGAKVYAWDNGFNELCSDFEGEPIIGTIEGFNGDTAIIQSVINEKPNSVHISRLHLVGTGPITEKVDNEELY